MQNVLNTSAKNVLYPSDAATKNKIFGWGTTTLIFSNKDLNNIMEIAKSLKNAGLLIKGVCKTVEKEVKEQKGEFLGMLAATLASSLLGNMSAGKKVIRADEWTNRAD